jgi:hypothetical protein
MRCELGHKISGAFLDRGGNSYDYTFKTRHNNWRAVLTLAQVFPLAGNLLASFYHSKTLLSVAKGKTYTSNFLGDR